MFFDNLQVSHIRGVMLEETHYYPFGLTMQAISSKALAFGTPENKKKFNEGTELNTTFDINLYETAFRSLDPQIGRFWQIDPMADVSYEFSPFVYGNDNPLTFNDPLGLMSDSLHPVVLQEAILPPVKTKVAPKEFIPYISFPNGQPYSLASKKDRPLSFSRDRSNDLLDSWAMGLGATNRVYNPNHTMTKRLMNAYQVNRARLYFYKKYIKNFKNGLSFKGASVTDFGGSFGLRGILNAGFDLTEQFVGSMSINIQVDEKGENMLFIVSNNTSKTSAFYHMANSHERTPGKEAMGNMYQVYIWKEPISESSFIKATLNHISSW